MLFETVCDALVPKSKWQQLAGFPSLLPSAATKEPTQDVASEGVDAFPEQFLKSFAFSGRQQHHPPTPEAPTQDTLASEGALPEEDDFEQPLQDNLPP
jgi:hypothetical protein